MQRPLLPVSRRVFDGNSWEENVALGMLDLLVPRKDEFYSELWTPKNKRGTIEEASRGRFRNSRVACSDAHQKGEAPEATRQGPWVETFSSTAPK